MEFEQLKKIWDTQNNRPMYAIDESALHARIRAKQTRATRKRDFAEYGSLVAIAATCVVLLLRHNGGIYDTLEILIMFLIGVYVAARRIRRIRRGRPSDRSMLGDLEHAIATTRDHIAFSNTFVWWFMAPTVVIVGLGMMENISGKPWWMWAMIAPAFVLGWWIIRREVVRVHLPRKRAMEALRAELLKEDRPDQ